MGPPPGITSLRDSVDGGTGATTTTPPGAAGSSGSQDQRMPGLGPLTGDRLARGHGLPSVHAPGGSRPRIKFGVRVLRPGPDVSVERTGGHDPDRDQTRPVPLPVTRREPPSRSAASSVSPRISTRRARVDEAADDRLVTTARERLVALACLDNRSELGLAKHRGGGSGKRGGFIRARATRGSRPRA